MEECIRGKRPARFGDLQGGSQAGGSLRGTLTLRLASFRGSLRGSLRMGSGDGSGFGSFRGMSFRGQPSPQSRRGASLFSPMPALKEEPTPGATPAQSAKKSRPLRRPDSQGVLKRLSSGLSDAAASVLSGSTAASKSTAATGRYGGSQGAMTLGQRERLKKGSFHPDAQDVPGAPKPSGWAALIRWGSSQAKKSPEPVLDRVANAKGESANLTEQLARGGKAGGSGGSDDGSSLARGPQGGGAPRRRPLAAASKVPGASDGSSIGSEGPGDPSEDGSAYRGASPPTGKGRRGGSPRSRKAAAPPKAAKSALPRANDASLRSGVSSEQEHNVTHHKASERDGAQAAALVVSRPAGRNYRASSVERRRNSGAYASGYESTESQTWGDLLLYAVGLGPRRDSRNPLNAGGSRVWQKELHDIERRGLNKHRGEHNRHRKQAARTYHGTAAEAEMLRTDRATAEALAALRRVGRRAAYSSDEDPSGRHKRPPSRLASLLNMPAIAPDGGVAPSRMPSGAFATSGGPTGYESSTAHSRRQSETRQPSRRPSSTAAGADGLSRAERGGESSSRDASPARSKVSFVGAFGSGVGVGGQRLEAAAQVVQRLLPPPPFARIAPSAEAAALLSSGSTSPDETGHGRRATDDSARVSPDDRDSPTEFVAAQDAPAAPQAAAPPTRGPVRPTAAPPAAAATAAAAPPPPPAAAPDRARSPAVAGREPYQFPPPPPLPPIAVYPNVPQDPPPPPPDNPFASGPSVPFNWGVTYNSPYLARRDSLLPALSRISERSDAGSVRSIATSFSAVGSPKVSNTPGSAPRGSLPGTPDAPHARSAIAELLSQPLPPQLASKLGSPAAAGRSSSLIRRGRTSGTAPIAENVSEEDRIRNGDPTPTRARATPTRSVSLTRAAAAPPEPQGAEAAPQASSVVPSIFSAFTPRLVSSVQRRDPTPDRARSSFRAGATPRRQQRSPSPAARAEGQPPPAAEASFEGPRAGGSAPRRGPFGRLRTPTPQRGRSTGQQGGAAGGPPLSSAAGGRQPAAAVRRPAAMNFWNALERTSAASSESQPQRPPPGPAKWVDP